MTMRIEGNPAPLFEALAKARAEFRPIRKTREVKVQSDRGSYTFSYAELDELIDATVPALAANGLSVFHTRQTESLDGKLVESVIHFLAHSSGAYLTAQQVIPMTKMAWDKASNGMVERRLSEQEFGSAFTYARRYAYQALLNLAAEDDDDANRADGNQAEVTRDRRQAPSPKPEPKAAPVVSQRPASEPPPSLRQAVEAAHPEMAEEDTRPAESDPETDAALRKAFGELRKDYAIPVVNSFAKRVTGKVPSGWTVSDGNRFLSALKEGAKPL